MSPESPGGSELTQAVTDHILGYVDRHMPASIMNRNGMTHQLGEYHAGPAPGSDNILLSALIHCFDFFQ
jgi:hypothetical protein